jgi:hypothetical protein
MESTPPKGMSYTAFRAWRRASSIRGSTSELAQAWKEYSTAPTLPTVLETPPTVTKPPTLPPDQPEILASLEELPLPLGVGIARSGLCFHDSLTRGMLYVFYLEGGKVCFSNVGNDLKPSISKWKRPVRGFVDSFVKSVMKGTPCIVHPSPLTLLEIYRLRKGCEGEYLAAVRKVVQDYYLEVSMTAIGVLVRDDDVLSLIQDSIGGQGSEYPPLIERNTLLRVTPSQRSRMDILRSVIGRVAWIAQDLAVLATLTPSLARIDEGEDASVLIHIFVSLLASLSRGYRTI